MKGRGTSQNPPNRFAPTRIELNPIDDEYPEGKELSLASNKLTQYFDDVSRSIITENNSPDIPFRYSVNPYRGCEHGCSYCYARPTHEYLGFSSGIDFEQKIIIKRDAARLLRNAFNAKNWQGDVVNFSGVTDVYQPIEATVKIMRQCLETLVEFRNPAVIITKNYRVTRDIDLLKKLSQYQAILVFISITTLNNELSAKLEPRASSPARRLKALQELSSEGIPCGVMIAPVIPGLNEHEIPSILQNAANMGASTASYSLLRLPHSVKDIFIDWIKQHYPLRATKVTQRIKQLRGGQLNKNDFGKRMRGDGFWAEELQKLFLLYRKKYALNQPIKLSSHYFRKSTTHQITLF